MNDDLYPELVRYDRERNEAVKRGITLEEFDAMYQEPPGPLARQASGNPHGSECATSPLAGPGGSLRLARLEHVKRIEALLREGAE